MFSRLVEDASQRKSNASSRQRDRGGAEDYHADAKSTLSEKDKRAFKYGTRDWNKSSPIVSVQYESVMEQEQEQEHEPVKLKPPIHFDYSSTPTKKKSMSAAKKRMSCSPMTKHCKPWDESTVSQEPPKEKKIQPIYR